MSQVELGRLCGKGRKAVIHWEHNVSSPTAADLAAIAAAVSVDMHWLITGKRRAKHDD